MRSVVGALAPLARKRDVSTKTVSAGASKEWRCDGGCGPARVWSAVLDRCGIEGGRRRRGFQERRDGGSYLRGAELRIATQPELRGLDHQGDQRVVVPSCADAPPMVLASTSRLIDSLGACIV